MNNISNINYDKVFCDTVKNLSATPSLLLHVCCAPCATYCLTQLLPYFDITLYYLNDNIQPFDEWEKRLDELKKLADIVNSDNFVVRPRCRLKLTVKDYDASYFDSTAGTLGAMPEGGARCNACIGQRLVLSTDYAKRHSFEYVTTTLTVSPYKNSRFINELGAQLAQDNWLYSDFKKRDGYRQSVQLSHKYNIYRQHYCGCNYSLQDSLQGANK